MHKKELRLKSNLVMFLFVLMLCCFGVNAVNNISSDSVVIDSVIIDSNIQHSTIDHSTVINSSVLYSSVYNTTLQNLTARFADVQDQLLIDGLIDFCNYTYSGPFDLNQIYNCVIPTSVGEIYFSDEDAIVHPGQTVIVYFKKDINLNVNLTINFPSPISAPMYDDGLGCDAVGGDGIYCYSFSVPSVSDGNFLVRVDFTDEYGNHLNNMKYLTVDSTPPAVFNVPSNKRFNTTLIELTFDTSEVSECRLDNSNVPFDQMKYVMLGDLHHQYIYNAQQQGLLNFYYSCKDLAGNIYSGSFDVFVDYTKPIVQQTLEVYSIFNKTLVGLFYTDNYEFSNNIKLYIDSKDILYNPKFSSLTLKFENDYNDESFFNHLVSINGNENYNLGFYGNAFYFDGTTYLTVPSSTLFDVTSNGFVINFWIKTTSSSGTVLQRANYYKVYLSSGYLVFEYNDSVLHQVSSSEVINDDNWHQINIVFDPTSNLIKLYVDFRLQDQTNFNSLTTSSNDLIIGYGDSYFSGNIDELVLAQSSGLLFFQKAFNVFYEVDTNALIDGPHNFIFYAYDNFSNLQIFNVYYYVNNYHQGLTILNLYNNSHLKTSPILSFLVPLETYKLELTTNCGGIASEIFADSMWQTLWNIDGLTATNCFVSAKSYDKENNLLATTNVSGIEIDNTAPTVDFSVSAVVNSDFTIAPTSDSDTVYYDLYVCGDFVTRFQGSYSAHLPQYYGSCNIVVYAYDEVGNVGNKSVVTFIDTKAPLVKIYYSGSELTNNMIFKDVANFDIITVDDNSVDSLYYCLDGVCNSSGNSFSINTSAYLQGNHYLYACANDTVDNLGCSNEYVIRFDNLVGNYPLYLYDFINNSYHYGVEEYSIHLPYQTYRLLITLNSSTLFDGLSYRFNFNTTSFSDGFYKLTLRAYDNLNNLLATITYDVFILNAILPSPTLTLSDRYDNDGIIYLNWTPVSGAKYYKIYRSFSNSTFEFLDSTTNTYFYDYLNEGKYRYYVVAVDDAEKEGNKSNIVETEVRLTPVVGSVKVDYVFVKPQDIINVKYYAFDDRSLNITANVFGSQYPLEFKGYVPEGYLYEVNISVPDVNGIYDLIISVKDDFGFEGSYLKNIVVDNIEPQPTLELLTLSTRGFEFYNSSVTALPYIFYSVATDLEDKCLVVESNFSEEFSPESLQINGVSYSGSIVGKPFDDDFVLIGNFSKSISLTQGTIYVRFYNLQDFTLKLGIDFNYTESLNKLDFCSYSLTLNKKWHTLMIDVDDNNIYLDGFKFTCNIANISEVRGENVMIDYLILSPNEPRSVVYGKCEDYLYLTTDDGVKSVAVLVKDLSGNVNLTYKTITLDKSGAKLDVTPPSNPVVVSNTVWVGANDSVIFTWYNATDFEQELLHLPLSYEVQVYENGLLIDNFITNSTMYVFNRTLTHSNQYYIQVRALNLAGLKSNFSQSPTVIADLNPPLSPVINSTTHQDCNWTNSPYFNATWSATDDLSGVKDYSFSLYLYNITQHNLTMIYNFVNKTSDSIPIVVDGRLYFYVVARDNAGNIGPVSEYAICADLTPPTRPNLLQFYQQYNSTDLYIQFSKSYDFESGSVEKYEIQLLDDNNVIIYDSNYSTSQLNDLNYSYSVVISGLPSGNYHARVRAFDLANNPSVWSDEKITVQDTTPPVFVYTTPSGEVIDNNVKITVKTDETAVCRYSVNNSVYYEFLYTNSTYHETYVKLPTSGSVNVDVICTNLVGLSSTTTINFTISSNGDLTGVTMNSTILTDPVVSETLMTVEVNINRGNSGIANIPRSWFTLRAYSSKYDMNITDFSLIDYGGGKYNLIFKAPPYNPYSLTNDPNYNLLIEVSDGVNVLTNLLSFNVSELRGTFYLENATNTSFKTAYTVESNVVYGVAVDDSSVYAASPEQVNGRANDGSFYLFVTVPNFNPSNVEPLLYQQGFENSPTPFGTLPGSEESMLNVIISPTEGSLNTNMKLPAGYYKFRVVHVGYDNDGKPIYEVQLIQ